MSKFLLSLPICGCSWKIMERMFPGHLMLILLAFILLSCLFLGCQSVTSFLSFIWHLYNKTMHTLLGFLYLSFGGIILLPHLKPLFRWRQPDWLLFKSHKNSWCYFVRARIMTTGSKICLCCKGQTTPKKSNSFKVIKQYPS